MACESCAAKLGLAPRVSVTIDMKTSPAIIALASILLLSSVLSVCGQTSASVQELLYEPLDEKRNRTVPVKVYVKPAEKPMPIILFSHGLGGSRERNAYLGKYWAEHGYIGVFMQHAGSDSSIMKSAPAGGRLKALKGGISLQASSDRYGDVAFVIDLLELWNTSAEHPLAGQLDLEKIGMSGHSFGAMTTQGLMGQKFALPRSYAEPRIDAFFAMSPSPGYRLTPEQAFGHIQSPVLLMTGSKDVIELTPHHTPEKRALVYAGLPAGDKYLLFLEDATHFAFSDGDRKKIPHHHPAIQQVSTRFWDAYLKGDQAAKAWLQSEQVREGAKLVAKDKWEWK